MSRRLRDPHVFWSRAAVAVALLGLLALLALAPAATSQTGDQPARIPAAPQLVVRADTGAVTVGDPVTLRIRMQLPAGGQIVDATPLFGEPLPEGIRLLHMDSLRAGGGGAETAAVTLALFRPGAARIPPIAVAYRVARGAPSDTALSAAVVVTVSPVVPSGSGTLRDIKNIDMAPLSLRSAAAIVIGGLGVILVIVLAGRFEQRRRIVSHSAGGPMMPGVRLGPYDAAMARLAEIAAAWTVRGDIETHYANTADVLRRYLADAHGVPALERTTGELVVSLPDRLAAPPARAAALELLAAADLVKFAWYAPAPPGPVVLLATARSVLSDWDAASAGVAAPDARASHEDGRTDGGGRLPLRPDASR
jgi:hypothetical protein